MAETILIVIGFVTLFTVVGYLGARATRVPPPRSNLPIARYVRPPD